MEIECTLKKQYQVNETCFLMRVTAPELVNKVAPGQFMMINVNFMPETKDPLLKRPLSIHRILDNGRVLEFLYKVVGKGTRALALLKPGDKLQLMGPFGTPISFPSKAERIAIVARGIGVAPTVAIMDAAKASNLSVFAYISASSEKELLCRKIIEEVADKTFITIDNYSEGNGMVTDYLEKTLDKTKIDAVYVCGSRRLSQHVARLKKAYKFEGLVLLEEKMACGFGACKGCVCQVKKDAQALADEANFEYKRVCVDGPAFPVEKVVFD